MFAMKVARGYAPLCRQRPKTLPAPTHGFCNTFPNMKTGITLVAVLCKYNDLMHGKERERELKRRRQKRHWSGCFYLNQYQTPLNSTIVNTMSTHISVSSFPLFSGSYQIQYTQLWEFNNAMTSNHLSFRGVAKNRKQICIQQWFVSPEIICMTPLDQHNANEYYAPRDMQCTTKL